METSLYRTFGAFATLTLQNLARFANFHKAFVSCNGGIQDNAVATFSEEEGESQRIALNRIPIKEYLLADHEVKSNKFDFYTFYTISLRIDYHRSDSKLEQRNVRTTFKTNKRYSF